MAPLGAALPLFPETVTKTERLLFGAVGIGGGMVSMPALKRIATKVFTGENGNGNHDQTKPKSPRRLPKDD